jgi:NADH dehydrogenase
MTEDLADVVTGAFSYSGSAIARELAMTGVRVRTLTGHPERAGAGGDIEVHPLDFDDQPALVESMRGARTLYNTYWVRFARGRVDHEVAVANSRTLFQCARRAGVHRIVHVSITNPSLTSPYPYFRGKAQVERALLDSGVPHTVLRPAILFGDRGVLINNIAWLLRRVPVFAVGGLGTYRIRGIHVADLAKLCLDAGARSVNSEVIDAVGPERPTFRELVEQIKTAVGSKSVIVPVPGWLLPPISAVLGTVLHDTLLTREEYQAMADGLADTTGPASGHTQFSSWLRDNAGTLGRQYLNELDLHFRPPPPNTATPVQPGDEPKGAQP